MRVLHLDSARTETTGSAARHIAASAEIGGCSSLLLTMGPQADGPDELAVVAQSFQSGGDWSADSLRSIADCLNEKYVVENGTGESSADFSFSAPALDFEGSDLLEWADVVHLHRVAHMVPPDLVEGLIAAGKGVVWTLHDHWPMTGGCHDPGDCTKFRQLCIRCPQLGDPAFLVTASFLDKVSGFSNDRLQVVAPSLWMSERARESRVFRNARIHTVATPVASGQFRRTGQARSNLRRTYDLGPDDVVLSFFAADLADRSMGLDLFVAALADLAAGRPAWSGPERRLFAAFAGAGALPTLPGGIEPIALGPLDDADDRAIFLGISDLLVHAACNDRHSDMVVAALCAGIQTVTFDVGNLRTLIPGNGDGVVLEGVPNASSLGGALARFIAAGGGAPRDDAARESAMLQRVGFGPIGERYAAIYRQALDRPAEATRAVSRKVDHQITGGATISLPSRLPAQLRRMDYPVIDYLCRKAGVSSGAITAAGSKRPVTAAGVAPGSEAFLELILPKSLLRNGRYKHLLSEKRSWWRLALRHPFRIGHWWTLARVQSRLRRSDRGRGA